MACRVQILYSKNSKLFLIQHINKDLQKPDQEQALGPLPSAASGKFIYHLMQSKDKSIHYQAKQVARAFITQRSKWQEHSLPSEASGNNILYLAKQVARAFITQRSKWPEHSLPSEASGKSIHYLAKQVVITSTVVTQQWTGIITVKIVIQIQQSGCLIEES